MLVPGQRLAIGLLVGPGGKIGFEAANAVGQRVHDFPRRCAKGAGIAVGNTFWNQEVLARRGEQGRVVRLCVWHEGRSLGERPRSGRSAQHQSRNGKDGKEMTACAHRLTGVEIGDSI